MMKLVSKFALLILIIAILYLLISRSLLSPSPFVIAGQLLAIALSIWARRSFQTGQFSIYAEPAEGPLLSTGPYQLGVTKIS
jgi:protein-S-isoprenylcysteine O-methyltransferase Ste14